MCKYLQSDYQFEGEFYGKNGKRFLTPHICSVSAPPFLITQPETDAICLLFRKNVIIHIHTYVQSTHSTFARFTRVFAKHFIYVYVCCSSATLVLLTTERNANISLLHVEILQICTMKDLRLRTCFVLLANINM